MHAQPKDLSRHKTATRPLLYCAATEASRSGMETRMRMHFLRNATFLLEAGQHKILVDPMLGPPGSFMSLTFVRGPKRNPIVPLPECADLAQLAAASACVLTHCRYGHTDHLDAAGRSCWPSTRSCVCPGPRPRLPPAARYAGHAAQDRGASRSSMAPSCRRPPSTATTRCTG